MGPQELIVVGIHWGLEINPPPNRGRNLEAGLQFSVKLCTRKILSEDMKKKQLDWDNPFLPVKAHLCLSIWGSCPGCNCGETAMGGLDTSCHASQVILPLTASGSRVSFPIGQKAFKGITWTHSFPASLSTSPRLWNLQTLVVWGKT